MPRARGRGLGGAGEGLDARHVEVVVVVVRDDDGVDPPDALERHRGGVQAPRADVLARRAALAPHRVEQQAHAVELDQRAGVANQVTCSPLVAGSRWALTIGMGPGGRRVSAFARYRSKTSRWLVGIEAVPRRRLWKAPAR